MHRIGIQREGEREQSCNHFGSVVLWASLTASNDSICVAAGLLHHRLSKQNNVCFSRTNVNSLLHLPILRLRFEQQDLQILMEVRPNTSPYLSAK